MALSLLLANPVVCTHLLNSLQRLYCAFLILQAHVKEGAEACLAHQAITMFHHLPKGSPVGEMLPCQHGPGGLAQNGGCHSLDVGGGEQQRVDIATHAQHTRFYLVLPLLEFLAW